MNFHGRSNVLSERPSEGEEMLDAIYALNKIPKDRAIASRPGNLSLLFAHLCLAAYYFYHDLNAQCLTHVTKALNLCEYEFGEDMAHWLSLASALIMVG